ncbi:hypothetical protein L2725_09780 [Shewanella corallii]|uniref:WD40-like Beta Propeller Repeat n=1 Tax=Shewanella corallii TaxID=560080 RepID=A0ABT0N7D9_9GAMM|nr:hypothetical protein [Shewanella corallii]MCL2914075.1 hypothetical protein [Shewanella corallii]
MKRISLSTPLLLSTLALSISSYGDDKLPAIEDRYFGETPPGLTPKLFAPGMLSPDGLFEGGTFSPDMREFYFSRKNGKYQQRTFFVIRYENGKWGKESETDIKWPKYSKDGNMMYGGREYRVKTASGWSEPKPQGEFLKDQAHGITLADNGTYYIVFFPKEDNGKGFIGYSPLIDGKQQTPIKLGSHINTGEYIAHPHVAPDESYLMWDVERQDGYGQPDIYISFREKDGSWGPALNMGNKINTPIYEQSPQLTPDGKYLFFKRGEWTKNEDGSRKWVGKSYWVDAQVIDNLKPKK